MTCLAIKKVFGVATQIKEYKSRKALFFTNRLSYVSVLTIALKHI
jgi:hypothetical protein